jgi:hypothetical protein
VIASTSRAVLAIVLASLLLRASVGTAHAVGGGPSATARIDHATLDHGVAIVPVPSGWDVIPCGKTSCVLVVGESSAATVKVARAGPDAQPSALVTAMLEGDWVKQAPGYSDVEPSDVEVSTVDGTAGAAEVRYSANWTDGSGSSVSIFGELVAVLRADDWVLGLQIEAWGETPDEAHTAFQKDEDLSGIRDGAVMKGFVQRARPNVVSA